MALSTAAYWDSRYALDDSPCDWLQSYDAIKSLLKIRFTTDAEVLVLGCGTSELSASLYRDGIRNISNVDFSSVVVQAMADRYDTLDSMDFNCLDVRDLGSCLRPSTFDVVIDKATLDCVMCAHDGRSAACKVAGSVFNLLKPGGTFILVTHGAPVDRIPLLLTPDRDWTVKHYELPRAGSSVMDHVYVLKKPVPTAAADDSGAIGDLEEQ